VRERGVMVSRVTTTPVGVVGHQGVTRERKRRDMTCGHRHLRSRTAPTLHRGADYVGTTLPHTRECQNNGGETRAFLSYLVDVGGHPRVYVCPVVCICGVTSWVYITNNRKLFDYKPLFLTSLF
jgi:hypothetical protein